MHRDHIRAALPASVLLYHAFEPQPQPAQERESPAQVGDRSKPALAELLASQDTAGPRDPKRWARRILERRAAGDPAVAAWQVRYARSALR